MSAWQPNLAWEGPSLGLRATPGVEAKQTLQGWDSGARLVSCLTPHLWALLPHLAPPSQYRVDWGGGGWGGGMLTGLFQMVLPGLKPGRLVFDVRVWDSITTMIPRRWEPC